MIHPSHRPVYVTNNFYNERKRNLLDPKIRPNAAHFSLAEFEKNCKEDFFHNK